MELEEMSVSHLTWTNMNKPKNLDKYLNIWEKQLKHFQSFWIYCVCKTVQEMRQNKDFFVYFYKVFFAVLF